MSKEIQKTAVLIAGPTASGKSGFAMSLAKDIDGIIVNADSMQVYEGLRVLTARPSVEDEAKTPHMFYGHVKPNIRYSVGSWLRDVKPVLREIHASNKTAIIIGGTGLYFRALTLGLAETPEISADTQQEFIKSYEGKSNHDLHALLSLQDNETAQKLEPNDRQRVLRALMVIELSGQSLLDWQRNAQANAVLPLEHTVHRVLMPSDRAWLYERIKQRFLFMVKNGGLEEAQDLLSQNIPAELPIMNAIGMPHFYQFFVERRYPVLSEAYDKSIRDTRRYAKRQLTWFRNQMAHWPGLDPLLWETDSGKMQADKAEIITELEKQA